MCVCVGGGHRFIHDNTEADRKYDQEMRQWLRQHTWGVLHRYVTGTVAVAVAVAACGCGCVWLWVSVCVCVSVPECVPVPMPVCLCACACATR